jgi:hypothetical protein
MMGIPRVRRAKSRVVPPALAKYLPAETPIPAKARTGKRPKKKKRKLDPQIKTVKNLKGDVVFVGTEAQWLEMVKEKRRNGWIYTSEGWLEPGRSPRASEGFY